MRLSARFNAWFDARLPLADHHSTGQRNTYILPTGAGALFGVLLLLLLLASINYQLSLGYALTFLLAGSALAGLHMTHATLRGLQMRLRTGGPAFAGGHAEVEITLDNPGAARHGIGLGWRPLGTVGPVGPVGRGGPVGNQGPPGHRDERAWTDVPARGTATVRLQLPLTARGWQPLPPIVAETRFPLGLFRAWTVWRPAARVLAWPKPEQPALPLPAGGAQATPDHDSPAQAHPPAPQVAPASQELTFDQLRPWRTGDALRQVAWKKAARTGELVSREAEALPGQALWLDEAAARSAAGGLEHRMSRLAAWVLAAEQAARPVGLRLGAQHWPPGSGDAHRRALLDALGTWNAGAR